MSNIIVYSGSFNPITNAHLAIVKKAMSVVNASKALLVLTPDLYLNRKSLKNDCSFYYSYQDRESIINASIEDESNISIWGEELGGLKPNRIKTLLTIAKENSDSQIYFILGSDKIHSVSHFLKPKNGKVSSNALKMITTIKHIIIDRNGQSSKEMIENDVNLNKYSDRFIYTNISDDVKDISSTLVRNNILANKSLDNLVNKNAINKIIKAEKIMSTNDLYSQIENEYVNGNRHGANNGNKLVYKDNIRVFTDWENNIDPYNFGSRDKFLNETKLYSEEFNVNDIKKNYDTITGTIDEDCILVAENLINSGYKTAILNLASRFEPCGGYDDGMNTQEESLCRVSNLSQSLYQYRNPNGKTNKILKRIEEAHVPFKFNGYPLDVNFGAIYTPNVTIFRNTSKKYFKPLEHTYKCDIITCAALNFNKYTKYQNCELIYSDESNHFNDAGLNVMKNKIRTIYRIAIENNNDALVLGAFGCGAFCLIPDDVAKLFNDVLHEPEFINKFKVIVFAIIEKKRDKDKYKMFYELFGNYNMN